VQYIVQNLLCRDEAAPDSPEPGTTISIFQQRRACARYLIIQSVIHINDTVANTKPSPDQTRRRCSQSVQDVRRHTKLQAADFFTSKASEPRACRLPDIGETGTILLSEKRLSQLRCFAALKAHEFWGIIDYSQRIPTATLRICIRG
jgi:hypothetical protein